MAPTISLAALAGLSDSELLAQVARLTAREREATVALIAHLGELDARQLYRAEGYPSLYTYCVEALHLSEHAAYGRIAAARAARRFPVVLERLADGSVNLTTVVLLAPHSTPDNYLELLHRARHKSRQQVETLVATLRPLPSVPSAVRRLPAPRPAPGARPGPVEAPPMTRPRAPEPEPSTGTSRPVLLPAAPAPLSPPARPSVVAPLASDRYKIQFTASAETLAKMRLAQDLLRHQIPDGDLAQVVDRAFTVLVDALLEQKTAATDRPRARRRSRPGSRHVPAAIRRAVWLRDDGRCAFVSRTGRRCSERGRLEFHHVRPYAEGGPATVENIELRCRAHNGYEAEQVFGPWARSQVREPATVYTRPDRALGPRPTRFKPSCPAAGRPP